MTGASGKPAAAPWQIRPPHPIIEGESLDGYVARVAAAEGIPNGLEITSLAGVRWGHRPELGLSCMQELPIVADCLGVPSTDLAFRSYPLSEDQSRRLFFGAALDRSVFEIRKRLFSPLGLVESAHHRAVWVLRPFPFCDTWWQFLQAACPDPDCGAIQGWYHTNGPALCDACGESLIPASAPEVPPDLRRALRFAVGLVHTDPARRIESRARLPDELQRLDTGDLLDLTCALAGVCDPSIRLPRNKRQIAPRAAPMAIVQAVAQAWDVLEGWPHAAEQMFSDRLAERTGRFGDGNKGATLAFLALANAPTFPSALRSLIVDLSATLADPQRGKDIKTAARFTGLRVCEISALRRGKLLRTVFSYADGHPLPLLCNRDLDSINEATRQSWSMTKTACALGISYLGVDALVLSGHLSVVAHPIAAFVYRERRVTIASVAALQDRIRSHLEVGQPREYMTLSQAVIGMPGLKPWALILDALARGAVRTMLVPSAASFVDQLYIHRKDLDRIRSIPAVEVNMLTEASVMMSKRDALASLGLHHRYGAATLDAWPSTTGPERPIPIMAVTQLASIGISPSETAARLQRDVYSITRKLAHLKISKVANGLFDRAEVEQLLKLPSGCAHPAGT